MDIETAINLVDKFVYQESNQNLNTIQINLLRGVWLNQSYEEIAEACYCSLSNIKVIGAAFWTELSQILGEKVTKKTIRFILESYHQDLIAGKSRNTRLTTQHNKYNLNKRLNQTNTIQPQEIPDSWFNSEILWRMTERLDHSLKRVSSDCNADFSQLQSFSEKLKLIHHLSAGNYRLNCADLDIIKICRDVIHHFTLNFPERIITFSLFEEPILPDYNLSISSFIDPKLVKYILTNLLSNALQYSLPNTPVTLDLNVEDQKGIFTIVDQGAGIPADELLQVFQPFYCASNTHHQSGDGLGLTIVEKSVKLHKGQFAVDSQIKQGCTFTVVLPVV
ncbi:MAG: ATP-binding protein [Microcoleaceae cyanobacterium]